MTSQIIGESVARPANVRVAHALLNGVLALLRRRLRAAVAVPAVAQAGDGEVRDLGQGALHVLREVVHLWAATKEGGVTDYCG